MAAGRKDSVGSVSDSDDNALAGSVVGLFKTELARWEGPWVGLDDLELAALGYVDWFNHVRHSTRISASAPPRTLRFRPLSAHLVGLAAFQSVPPLWESDHAGVVATLRLHWEVTQALVETWPPNTGDC